jgi:hypothetical protein
VAVLATAYTVWYFMSCDGPRLISPHLNPLGIFCALPHLLIQLPIGFQQDAKEAREGKKDISL